MITAEAPPETMPRRTPIRRQPTQSIERLVLTGFMGSGKNRHRPSARRRPRLGLPRPRHRNRAPAAASPSPKSSPSSANPTSAARSPPRLAALLGRTRIVIALGGGAPEDLGNRLLLEQTPNTEVVFLAAPFAILVARCETQALEPNAIARPVLADREKAAQRFETRQRIYQRIANHKLETSTMSPDETLEALLRYLSPKITA